MKKHYDFSKGIKNPYYKEFNKMKKKSSKKIGSYVPITTPKTSKNEPTIGYGKNK